MPVMRIPPKPDWADPEKASVTDPLWKTLIRKAVSAGQLAGLDDPSQTIYGLSSPMVVAGAVAPILTGKSQGLLKTLLGRLKMGEPLENIPRDLRQAAMGMEDTVYHGTRNKNSPLGFLRPFEEVGENPNFSEFIPDRGLDYDFGIHFDKNPNVADAAISVMKDAPGGPHYGNGGQILPLKARMTKTLDLPDMGSWRDPYEFARKLPGAAYKIVEDEAAKGGWAGKLAHSLPVDDVTAELRQEALRMASKFPNIKGGLLKPNNIYAAQEAWPETFKNTLNKYGYDSVRYLNNAEGVGAPSHMVFEPEQVRSVFANFDPRKILSGNLNASVAGAGVAGGLLGGQLAKKQPIE